MGNQESKEQRMALGINGFFVSSWMDWKGERVGFDVIIPTWHEGPGTLLNFHLTTKGTKLTKGRRRLWLVPCG